MLFLYFLEPIPHSPKQNLAGAQKSLLHHCIYDHVSNATYLNLSAWEGRASVDGRLDRTFPVNWKLGWHCWWWEHVHRPTPSPRFRTSHRSSPRFRLSDRSCPGICVICGQFQPLQADVTAPCALGQVNQVNFSSRVSWGAADTYFVYYPSITNTLKNCSRWELHLSFLACYHGKKCPLFLIRCDILFMWECPQLGTYWN